MWRTNFISTERHLASSPSAKAPDESTLNITLSVGVHFIATEFELFSVWGGGEFLDLLLGSRTINANKCQTLARVCPKLPEPILWMSCSQKPHSIVSEMVFNICGDHIFDFSDGNSHVWGSRSKWFCEHFIAYRCQFLQFHSCKRRRTFHF